MKSPVSIAGLAGFAIALMILSCSKNDSVPVYNPPQEFVVRMDSVKLGKNPHPDTLRAQLWGRIGNSTCYQFSRYQTTRDSFQVRVKVFGTYTESSSCTPATIELRGAVYRIEPPFYPGTFTVIVLQPDGSTLRDSVGII